MPLFHIHKVLLKEDIVFHLSRNLLAVSTFSLSDVDVASCAPFAVGFEPHESCLRTTITTTLLKRHLKFSMYGMIIARLLLMAFVHRKVCEAVVCVRRAETKVLVALNTAWHQTLFPLPLSLCLAQHSSSFLFTIT